MVLEAAYNLKPLLKLKDISYEWLLDLIKIATLFMSEPENAAVVTVALAGTYCAYRMFHSPNAKRFPDFPGREFLSGHGPMIDSSESESEATVRLNPQSLPAGYARMFLMKFLLVCDLKLWKDIFVTNGAASSGRTHGYQVHMDNNFKSGIIWAKGDQWKQNRRIFLNHLRQWGKEKQFEVILDENSFLMEAIEESPTNLDVSRLLEKVFCNITCTFTFGSRISYNDPELEIILGCIDMINVRKPLIPDFLWPIIAKIPMIPLVKRQSYGIQKVKAYLRGKIEALLVSGVRDPPETLVEAYALDIMGSESGKLNLDFLVGVVYELFFAGTETTSNTIESFLACMATHPEIQDKLFEEVQSVVGDKKLNAAHLKSLDYLQAVQFEVQRFCCIVENVAPHTLTKTVELECGHQIQKNETVVGSISWVMRDPKLWKHPHTFNPENFLDKDGKFESNEAFIPYGMGPRVCLGQNLADLELKITICELIRKFRVSSDDNIDLNRKILGFTTSPFHYRYNFLSR